MNKKILGISIIALSCVLFAKQTYSPFITKKKTRGLSKSKLKEQNIQELGALLQTLPGLIKLVAQTQELAMQRLTEYLEGKKKCFWYSASCEQLLQCKNHTMAFQKKVKQMYQQLQNFAHFLQTIDQTFQVEKVQVVSQNKTTIAS